MTARRMRLTRSRSLILGHYVQADFLQGFCAYPDLHPLKTREVNIGIDRLAPVSSRRDDPTLLRHRNHVPAYIEAENPSPLDREGWN
jgi:hypothetical protein